MRCTAYNTAEDAAKDIYNNTTSYGRVGLELMMFDRRVKDLRLVFGVVSW